MRLIDADDTMNQLRAYADRKHAAGHNELANGILKAVSYIRNNTVRVDAVPVVHGRWVLVKPRRAGRNATYKCTACGQLRSSYYNDVTQWKHCPCGARMDGYHET